MLHLPVRTPSTPLTSSRNSPLSMTHPMMTTLLTPTKNPPSSHLRSPVIGNEDRSMTTFGSGDILVDECVRRKIVE
ncbi:hypothetical protein HN873_062305, partial [Arachis hypogaea]